MTVNTMVCLRMSTVETLDLRENQIHPYIASTRAFT